jgi:hypothetical protein
MAVSNPFCDLREQLDEMHGIRNAEFDGFNPMINLSTSDVISAQFTDIA